MGFEAMAAAVPEHDEGCDGWKDRSACWCGVLERTGWNTAGPTDDD